MRRKIVATVTISVVLLLCASLVGYFMIRNGSPGKIGDLFLVRPALAAGNATFLDQEAGMSLYFKATGPIDLSVAKGAFKTVESQTSTYVIGSVSLPGLTDQDDVHCYVQQDGWIVVYYLNGETLIKIIDWASYNGDALTSNKLKMGLDKVCDELGLTATDTKYYDFKYPYANKWMIATDNGPTNSFTITIPSGFTVYERSWSFQGIDLHSYYVPSCSFNLDGTVISSVCPGTEQGEFTASQLAPDIVHTFGMTGQYSASHLGVALVYREP